MWRFQDFKFSSWAAIRVPQIPLCSMRMGYIFVKALDKTGKCFQYLHTKFPKLSDAKIKEGTFVGPQIRKLLKDDNFLATMNDIEKKAWISFTMVVQQFLGNRKSENYKQIVAEMLENFHKLGSHFLYSHIDYFPENLGVDSALLKKKIFFLYLRNLT